MDFSGQEVFSCELEMCKADYKEGSFSERWDGNPTLERDV